jgi:hypothetical protein
LPEIDGKVELSNKSPSTDGCVRCRECCGIKLSIIQSNFTFYLPVVGKIPNTCYSVPTNEIAPPRSIDVKPTFDFYSCTELGI